MDDGPTLNEVLASRGLTTRPAGHGRKTIHDKTGREVASGRAHDVWAWLATQPPSADKED